MGDRLIARLLLTQYSIVQKNTDIHSCLGQDSNSRFQCSSGSRQ